MIALTAEAYEDARQRDALRRQLAALLGTMTLEELQVVDGVCVEVMRRREDQEEGGTER